MEDNININNNAPPAAFNNSYFENNNINNNNDSFNLFSLFPNNNIINEENKNKEPNSQNKIFVNLDIMITSNVLKELNKVYLIDLIMFLKSYCKIMIEEKYKNFKHDIFKIIRHIKNFDEYFLIIQNKENKNNIKEKNVKNKSQIILSEKKTII